MKSRVEFVLIAAITCLGLGGCVSTGTYQAKEQESQQLGKSLDEMKASYAGLQEKCAKVETASSEQGDRLKKLAAELAELKQENERLAAAARPDNLLKALGESFAALQQKVEQLKAENTKMKQELLVPQQLQPVAPPPRKSPVDGAKSEQSGSPSEQSASPPAGGAKPAEPVASPAVGQ